MFVYISATTIILSAVSCMAAILLVVGFRCPYRRLQVERQLAAEQIITQHDQRRQQHDVVNTWCHDVVNTWCHDVVNTWCHDVVNTWCHERLMSRCRQHLMSSTLDVINTWCSPYIIYSIMHIKFDLIC